MVFLIVFLPNFVAVKSDDMQLIYQNFLGTKSKYQGIIEIWNVDTFESGSASKTSYLSSMAKSYQRKNRGLYFMVRNLTEQECMNLLESGQSPDLFSCSYGVAEQIREHIQSFSATDDVSIKSDFLNAGKVGDELYGLAWCRGVYCLISTAKHLERAKVENVESVKLSDIVLSSGFKTTNKNKETITYSVTYGANKYNLPNNALPSYNDSGLESVSELAIDVEANTQTQYSAYCNFIAEKSTILLGSQRDVIRMENRVKLGKVTDVIYQPLNDYCDLVQFMFLAKTENKDKLFYMEDFSKFLTSAPCQERLSEIGMFAVAPLQNNPYKNGIMFDIASEIDGVCRVKNVLSS